MSSRRRTAPEQAGERLIRLQRSRPEDREVTLYVKGFLGRGEGPEHFDAWLASHRRLQVSHGWGPRAYGYCWPSGRWRRLPLPAATATKLAFDLYRFARRGRRVALAGGLGLIVAEQAIQAALRLGGQYLRASRAARSRSFALAARLERLGERYAHVRVVAHSLGCVQVIEAAALLEPLRRPHEIHLCAPACREGDVAEKLDRLGRERVVLYHSRSDLVLEAAFRLLARGRALGAVGPSGRYAGLSAIDVSEHFGLRVHGDYKHRLPEFAWGRRADPAGAERAGPLAGTASAGGQDELDGTDRRESA